MTTYTIYDRFGDPVPLAVPDGFSWLAFLLPPVFALAHGLWLELIAFVLGVIVLVLLGTLIGFGAAFWIYVVLALLVGFEAAALRRAALQRRGFRYRADLVASNAPIALVQYLRAERLG